MTYPCAAMGQTVLWNEEKYSVMGVAPGLSVGAGFGIAVLLIVDGTSMYVNQNDVQFLQHGEPLARSVTTVSDPKVIGNTLRKARLRLNMTQGNMADLLGISTSQWSAIENAKQEPKL